MNDPLDPFTSVSSAWLLGSASNCGSVWFTVRKRWKRSANNRLGKLEISSKRGEEGREILFYQFLIQHTGDRNRFKEPWASSLLIHSFHLRKQLRVIVSCGWLAPVSRTRYSLLDTSYDYYPSFLAVSRHGARSRNQPLLRKKRKKKEKLITGWVHDPIRNRGFLARVIYPNPDRFE